MRLIPTHVVVKGVTYDEAPRWILAAWAGTALLVGTDLILALVYYLIK
jgi:hypothetical protein